MEIQRFKRLSIFETPDDTTLNNYFTNIGPVLDKTFDDQHHEIPQIQRNKKTMAFHPTDIDEVPNFPNKLKNKRNTCHDGKSNEMMKCCSL